MALMGAWSIQELIHRSREHWAAWHTLARNNSGAWESTIESWHGENTLLWMYISSMYSNSNLRKSNIWYIWYTVAEPR